MANAGLAAEKKGGPPGSANNLDQGGDPHVCCPMALILRDLRPPGQKMRPLVFFFTLSRSGGGRERVGEPRRGNWFSCQGGKIPRTGAQVGFFFAGPMIEMGGTGRNREP